MTEREITVEYYIELIKKLKVESWDIFDWGMDRFYKTETKTYIFMYRDIPNSNANDIIHLMIR
jgi:hypothetical protein